MKTATVHKVEVKPARCARGFHLIFMDSDVEHSSLLESYEEYLKTASCTAKRGKT